MSAGMVATVRTGPSTCARVKILAVEGERVEIAMRTATGSHVGWIAADRIIASWWSSTRL